MSRAIRFPHLLAALLLLLGPALFCQAQMVPTPVIGGISPSSVAAGSATFNLTVAGQGLGGYSQVRWFIPQTEQVVPLATSYDQNLNVLIAVVPSYLVGSPGTVEIYIRNDVAGYTASSSSVPFIIVPGLIINSVSPNALTAGCTGVVLTILGSGFVAESTVQWAGPVGGLQTPQVTFVSTNQLRATIPNELLTAPGAASVRVLNPGGLLSNTLDLSIAPAPVIQALKPNSAPAGTPGFTLTVTGSGFVPSVQGQAQGSVVLWTSPSGSVTTLATTYHTPGQLSAVVPDGLLAAGGTAQVAVMNPPCGVRSNLLPFEIVTRLAVTTTLLPNGTVGMTYRATLAAAGGLPPYTWAVAEGSRLPAGLLLTPSSGAITGTPTLEGTFAFDVVVTDSLQSTATGKVTITIVRGLSITTASLPAGIVGVAYRATLAASGGQTPYSWSVSAGSLPPGLSLDAGVIAGTPTQAGTYNFTVRVVDRTEMTATRAFTVTIEQGLIIVTASPLPAGTVNAIYSQKLLAYGGQEPYTWSMISGSLPPGLSLNGQTGDITGTPTTAGTYNFTVQVTDAAPTTATKAFSLTVNPAELAIITASPLPSGAVGVAYSQTLAATGGTAPYSWSTASGALPPGLSLNASTGVVSGTPTVAGASSFTIQVTDSARRNATRAFTLTIAAAEAPQLRFSGVSSVVQPTQQPRLQVNLASAYPAPISGRLTLVFSHDALVALDNPEVQFASGGRTVDFTVPAGATGALFGSAQEIGLQAGTVAGTITVTASLQAGGVNITPSPAPSTITRVNRLAPVISSVRVTRTATGFEVETIGYATPRQVTTATFRFAASAADVQTPEVTVTVDSAFTTWYRNTASGPFGSQFRYVQPFTVSGEGSALTSVTVTLANATGTSAAASANF